MHLRPVLHFIGVILRLFGLTLLVPGAVAIGYGEHRDAVGFGIAALIGVLVGHLFRLAETEPDDLRRVDALGVVAGAWLVVSAVAAVPYAWVGLSPTDAMFEAMSGLTTTGATAFAEFGRYGRGIFFWRALTQWLGGLGVIALFVVVLPRLAIAGRQLFIAETPGPTEDRLAPQFRRTAVLLLQVYVGLTAAQVAVLLIVGMPGYDAIVHAFTTLAAGGFSPHPRSIEGYANPTAEWVIAIFMFLAGANFALQYRALRGRPGLLFRDDEFRAYTAIVVVSSLALTWFLWREPYALNDAVRLAVFQVISILTTTGYASADFQTWSDPARFVLLVLLFIGGSAGSAAGGPKVVRQVLIARYTLLELRRTLHPQAVLPVKLNGRVVPDEVMRAVLVFFLFYLLVFAICAAVVSTLEADILTGISASIATLGNTGPGFNIVGPMASYAPLHDVSKVVLTAAMWMGRLELLTVLALLRPEVWRSATWKRA